MPSPPATRQYLGKPSRFCRFLSIVAFSVTLLFIGGTFFPRSRPPVALDVRRAEAQPPSIHVAIMSAPGNFAQRTFWRARCSDALRAVGIKPFFYVGHPSHDNHDRSEHTSGHFATEQEQTLATQLYEEAKAHEDLVFLPFRDNYLDLTDKTLNVFDKGCRGGAQLLVKVDDDMCVNTEPLLTMMADHVYNVGSTRMLYGGIRLWNNTREETALGPHGEFAPFFAGPIYVLSCNLVTVITQHYNAFSNLFAMYGNSGEDVNVAKWVKKVRDDFPQYQIDYKMMKVGYYAKTGPGSRHPRLI